MSKENALHRLIFRSKLYNNSLIENKIRNVSKININPFPGNKEIGNKIFKGNFLLSGHNLDLRGQLPWQTNAPKIWKRDFHSFFWLHHLRATDSLSASTYSQTIINRWIEEYGQWDEFVWNLPLIAKRLENWILNYDFIVLDAKEKFLNKFIHSFYKQLKHFLRWNNLNENSIDNIQSALTLYLSGVFIGKKKLSQKGVKLINNEIEKNDTNKNTFKCSNSSEILNILRVLYVLDEINNQTFKFSINKIDQLIDYFFKVIITLTHPDERLSIFNGSFEDSEYVNITLKNLKLKKTNIKPLLSITDLGFERMNVKRLLIIAKSGKFNSPKKFLGPLSFEASIGKERLIVNCGTFSGEDKNWKELSKTNHAYSTLTINNSDPEYVYEKKYFEPTLRGDEETNSWLEIRHHGYRKKFGIIHVRRIHVYHDAMEIRGNDTIIAIENFDCNKKNLAVLRFHLHPSVSASSTGNNEEILLRPNKGAGWLFKVNSLSAKVDESVYLGIKGKMKRSQQIVVEFDIVSSRQEILWKFLRLPGRGF